MCIILNVFEKTQNCRTHYNKEIITELTVKRIVYFAFHVERSSFTIFSFFLYLKKKQYKTASKLFSNLFRMKMTNTRRYIVLHKNK